jgi:hypothetical protein
MNPVSRPWWVAVLVIALAGCAKDRDEPAAPAATPAAANDSGPGVTVDADLLQRLGIELAAVRESPDAAVADGLATVLDGAALAATLDEIAAAREDTNSQEQNVRRLQGLYDEGGNASRQALEAARAQLATSRARLTAAESRARADWGAALIGAHGAAPGGALEELRRGQGALLRAEFATPVQAPAQLHYSILATANNGAVAAQFLGMSRAPTQSTSGIAITLAVAAADAEKLALRPGTRLSVIATAPNATTVAVVPASAAIADAGSLWCYVQRGNGRFDRVALDAEQRLADGYPATSLRAGVRVVVRGAPLLLSLERGAGAPAPAED